MYIYNIFFSLKYSDAGLTFLWKRCVCLWGWTPFPALRQWWEMSIPPIYAASIFWMPGFKLNVPVFIKSRCMLCPCTFQQPHLKTSTAGLGKTLMFDMEGAFLGEVQCWSINLCQLHIYGTLPSILDFCHRDLKQPKPHIWSINMCSGWGPWQSQEGGVPRRWMHIHRSVPVLEIYSDKW